jgi:hypothetical protein
MRMDTDSSSQRTEHSRGGASCSLRPRRRETSAHAPPFLKAPALCLCDRETSADAPPFLKVLFTHHSGLLHQGVPSCVCVFITAGPMIKLCAEGEGDREGHVL